MSATEYGYVYGGVTAVPSAGIIKSQGVCWSEAATRPDDLKKMMKELVLADRLPDNGTQQDMDRTRVVSFWYSELEPVQVDTD